MLIFAIDPGSEQSAYVVLDSGRVVAHDTKPNDDIVGLCVEPLNHRAAVLVVEQFESYGMAVGAECYRTVWWSGRFYQAWRGQAVQMPRRLVKLHLCHSARATDANIRQAILDRFGRTKAEAIGKKASPGPLYGLKGHEYAALAVALTWADLHGSESSRNGEGQATRGMVLD